MALALKLWHRSAALALKQSEVSFSASVLKVWRFLCELQTLASELYLHFYIVFTWRWKYARKQETYSISPSENWGQKLQKLSTTQVSCLTFCKIIVSDFIRLHIHLKNQEKKFHFKIRNDKNEPSDGLEWKLVQNFFFLRWWIPETLEFFWLIIQQLLWVKTWVESKSNVWRQELNLFNFWKFSKTVQTFYISEMMMSPLDYSVQAPQNLDKKENLIMIRKPKW